jgi:hypothetical protein
MSERLTAIAVIGIDIGKNSFHIVGHDQCGGQDAVREALPVACGRRPGKVQNARRSKGVRWAHRGAQRQLQARTVPR